MTEFVLVRHGETDWNAEERLHGSIDIPLNARGISQARAVASILCADHWDAIVSSPLQRAYQTAVQIVDPLDFGEADIVVNPLLKERFYGDAEGIDLAERRTRWPDKVWPNAETPEAMDERTGAAMRDLAALYEGKRVVIVAHGGWIRSALRVVSGHDPAVLDIVIPNASCSWVTFADGAWKIGELGIAEYAPLFD